jgi:hypothetical protein
MSQHFVVPSHRTPRGATSAASHVGCQASRSQSMKIEGASRRSAAPGSQFVGVAEYGDDLAPPAAPFAGSYRNWQLPWRALDT